MKIDFTDIFGQQKISTTTQAYRPEIIVTRTRS